MQLYPNAKLLGAAKEDLSRDRRKHLTDKIASGEWDGIIVTHSSFERIGMSREYQEKFLREQIDEYDQLLREHAADRGTNRNLIKTIEKQKAARVERLKDLLAEDKSNNVRVASCARATRTRKWLFTAMSPKAHSTPICGRRSKPRPGSSPRS
jgi:N12 class adenine-specific DNA methylase